MGWKLLLVGIIPLAIGIIVGCFVATSIWANREYQFTERTRALQNRIEGYVPTCDQLKSEGIHGPVHVSQDYVLVQVGPDYFHVLGFNTDPGIPPSLGWWGAGRQESQRQACEHGQP